MGLLLAQCTGLQVLCVSGDLRPKGSLLLEAALLAATSTSSSSSSRALQANPSTRAANPTLVTACVADITPMPAAADSGDGGEGSGGGRGSSSGMSHAPLLQLQLSGVPLAPFAAWLQQRGQLGQLQRLELVGWPFPGHEGAKPGPSHFDQSCDWLISLTGLQEMHLETGDSTGGLAPGDDLVPRPLQLQPGLTALRSLTALSLEGFAVGEDVQQALSALTQLKQLQLVVRDQPQPLTTCWLTALKQLTHLDLHSTYVDQLPEELGASLPHLEVLLVPDCGLWLLPMGLTRLSYLDASANGELGVGDELLEVLRDATALRRLNLSGCNISTTAYLTALTALEVLQLQASQRWCFCTHSYLCEGCQAWVAEHHDLENDPPLPDPGSAPLYLPLMPNLRHLDLRSGEWWVENLVTLGPLQHLTYLDLWDGVADREGESNAGQLPNLGVLPSLQQLNLRGVPIAWSQWGPVGAWLGLQTQLTRLSLRDSTPLGTHPSWAAQERAEGLAQLPTQLVELDLTDCGLQLWPPRVGEMTRLQVLLVGHNQGLPGELPPWLPTLQQLEVLEVHAVAHARAAVRLLQQLPALRQFSMSEVDDGALGEEVGPAQRLYEQLPHLQCVESNILQFGLFGELGLEPGKEG
jgi:hypothetical protein